MLVSSLLAVHSALWLQGVDKEAAMIDVWLDTDEREDVLSSIVMCRLCVTEAINDRQFVKWAILSLHNALQGAMVCHLMGTANLGALDRKSFKRSQDWHQRDRCRAVHGEPTAREKFPNIPEKAPETKIADSRTLFSMLSNEHKRQEWAGDILSVTEGEKRAFEKLHGLRNEFAHFSPKGWSIELSGVPEIFRCNLDVLTKIASDGWPFRHMKEERLKRLNLELAELRAAIDELEKRLDLGRCNS
ncbi:hypothetical protein [Thalassospira sp. MCCC 1A02491]|uniref:hypothetical protein n=1 Tax=Thalassospira sp. MCCC 1A02491 TaxID=1769751 RepID=UPI0008397AAD|nr:hypothetical protein [Thalassospira sp. MCCC 1A02491]